MENTAKHLPETVIGNNAKDIQYKAEGNTTLTKKFNQSHWLLISKWEGKSHISGQIDFKFHQSFFAI